MAAISAGIVIAGFVSRSPNADDLAARVTGRTPAPVATPATALAALERGPRPSFGWPVASPALTQPDPVIELSSPSPADGLLTSNRLIVAGIVLVKAARVEVVLAANGNRRFGHSTSDVSDQDGGIRPARPPSFDVQFDLATPRPMGTMLVVVTAYDATGTPIGAVRRAVAVGSGDGR